MPTHRLYDKTQGTTWLNTSAFDSQSLRQVKPLCRKRLCLIVPCVSSYRRVQFSRAVLFCQPHQQLFTHSLDISLRLGKRLYRKFIHVTWLRLSSLLSGKMHFPWQISGRVAACWKLATSVKTKQSSKFLYIVWCLHVYVCIEPYIYHPTQNRL